MVMNSIHMLACFVYTATGLERFYCLPVTNEDTEKGSQWLVLSHIRVSVKGWGKTWSLWRKPMLLNELGVELRRGLTVHLQVYKEGMRWMLYRLRCEVGQKGTC